VTAPPALSSLVGLLEFLALPVAVLCVIFGVGLWQTTREAARARAARPEPTHTQPEVES